MSKVLVFDTETVSLDKPFMYNLGWVVLDLENGDHIEEKDYVVERVWHNTELMNTAYYKEKRPLYIKRMRSRKVKMLPLSKILGDLRKTIKKFNIKVAYAFNSSFDERVFDYNCDFYRLNNPLEQVAIRDIRKVVLGGLLDINEYREFIKESLEDGRDEAERAKIRAKFITEKGRMRTTAESIYCYLMLDCTYCEEHTALEDSKIEAKILYAYFTLPFESENCYQACCKIASKVNLKFGD